MESQSIKANLKSVGQLFESYRRINPNKIKRGYPNELKNRVIFLMKNGVDKNTLLEVTKISPPTLNAWISQQNETNIDLPSPKELKIIEDIPDSKVKITLSKNISDKYCAKINVNNGMSIELTEQGLLLSLNILCGVV